MFGMLRMNAASIRGNRLVSGPDLRVEALQCTRKTLEVLVCP